MDELPKLLSKSYVKSYEIICDEEINMKKFKHIVDNYTTDLAEVVGFVRNLGDGSYAKLDSNGTFTLLNSMYENRKKSNKVSYKFAGRIPEGRLFSRNLGLQGCNRIIRKTISNEFYYDIDMKSAHPTICVWYCKYKNIPCEYLEEYINNRDNCLLELQTAYGLSRDDAKDEILKLLNGGVSKLIIPLGGRVPEWFKLFRLEINNILDKILAENQDIAKRISHRTDYKGHNLRGKVANVLYCKIENNLLISIVDYCNKNGIKIGALCFDGLLVSKKTIDDIDTTLREMEEYVKNEYDFDLTLVCKDMTDEVIDLSKYELEDEFSEEMTELVMTPRTLTVDLHDFNSWEKFILTETNIEDIEELFCNTVFSISNNCNSSHFATKTKEYDDRINAWFYKINTQNNTLLAKNSLLYKKTRIRNSKAVSHLYPDGDKKDYSKEEFITPSFIDILYSLLFSNRLKTYNTYEFEPYYGEIAPKTMNNNLNLFTGFKLAVDNYYLKMDINDNKEWFENSLMFRHINEILCNNDLNFGSYVLNYIAHMIQCPNENPGTLLLFVSEQGAGKDIFASFIATLIGYEYYINYISVDDYFTNFNASQEAKFLIVLNEISDGSTDNAMFKKHNKLKGRITEENTRIEKKGKDAFTVRNYSRYFAFSQFDSSMNVEHSDRRTASIKCNNKYVNDPVYFEPLRRWIASNENKKRAFAYLATKDLSGYNPRVIPKTSFKKSQIINCLNSCLQFIINMWVDFELQDDFYAHTTHFYELYKKYCQNTGSKPINRNVFKTRLNMLGLEETECRKKYDFGCFGTVNHAMISSMNNKLYSKLFELNCDLNLSAKGYVLTKKKVELLIQKHIRDETFKIE
jgi:hypothetical protein